jgi:hypothetical protein
MSFSGSSSMENLKARGSTQRSSPSPTQPPVPVSARPPSTSSNSTEARAPIVVIPDPCCVQISDYVDAQMPAGKGCLVPGVWCHRLVSSTLRPTRVEAKPGGCQMGDTDHAAVIDGVNDEVK